MADSSHSSSVFDENVMCAQIHHRIKVFCKSYTYASEHRCGNIRQKLRVNAGYEPKPVLTVSPLWLSPGASVTLNCSVKDPSAGWSFYWYKIIPKLSGSSYSFELLTGSRIGTDQDSYVVHGQTHTAGYVCRAGRGDPVSYTPYSKPAFVWSGDFHPASVKVSLIGAQHFSSESVSLSCEGNSAKWRVLRFTEARHLANCSEWGTMTGSTCKIHKPTNNTAVYWCESGSGQFSNAVNITAHTVKDIILVSPVHPVTRGDSVTLGCKLRTGGFDSNVVFLRNDDVIQNDTRGELIIDVVSKSDEGFYRCEYSGRASRRSWMSVRLSRPERFPFLQLLIVVLVCGILLIILLLLLCCNRKFKDSCSPRTTQSQRTSQGSAPDEVVTQNKTPPKVHSSHLHGDACLSESIRGPGNTGNDADDSSDVTYSLIQLKNIRNKGQHNEPEESSLYSNVKMGSAAGKSSPAVTDETVYSEVKLQGQLLVHKEK
ncbi:platelet endothelial cell adhesion molecule-like [Enoplosus armatus]|uniref:platelet endothelial cell adhesion molecule-like n=1 Tax=Enoplosus armatus TaxID=215367 RepID=UPI003992A4ED